MWKLAPRRRHDQKIATRLNARDTTERRITGLYAEAVEQLSSDEPRRRLAGLYALERLAQDNSAHRQAVVDVFCTYLRMPFSPTSPTRTPEPEAAAGQKELGTQREIGTDGIGRKWQEEREVRLVAQRILAGHLRDDRARDRQTTDPPSPRLWNDIRLDLTNARLIHFSLANAVIAEANFCAAAFSDSAVFSGVTFTGAARFDAATFGGAARFGGATFGGAARFGAATFSRVASFSGAIFGDDARFGGAAFGDDAQFDRAAFAGGAGFRGTAFGGGAWFDKAAFRRDACFDNAIFTGDARFDRVTFGGDAGFNGAAFGSDAWFDEATFSRGASFDEAVFGRDVWFDIATFRGGATFDEAAFTGDASFAKASITGSAWFGEAMFSGAADALHFEQARILSPGASHVWPPGWRLADADGGRYAVVKPVASTASRAPPGTARASSASRSDRGPGR